MNTPALPTVRFSLSEVKRFYDWMRDNRSRDPRRLGQKFHDYFDLNKITSPANKAFFDYLYERDGIQADLLIDSITDYSN